YLNRPYTKKLFSQEYSEESIVIVSLLHDLCKMNCYKTSFRNTKNEAGQWVKVPYFEFEDNLPYGHGEKSVYIISGFMRLSREEAFAIRYHMGFTSTDDARKVSKAFEMYPLAFALSVADQEASFYLEETK
ncbi:MAG: hydrolase, partial [Clostridia bacterium]|nr:hydrolase [Clostridia bacterium]